MSYKESETISRLIIDKLISNVIIENNSKYVNSIFNSHIEKFIFDMISPLMKADYIFHETGLDKIDKNLILYDKPNITKINTWVTIPEPETCTGDRYVSKNKLIKPKYKTGDKNLIIFDNSFKEQPYELENKNSLTIEKTKSEINKGKNKYKIKLFKRKILINKQKKESNENKNENEKDKKNEPILEIEGIDIPYDKKERIHILLNDTQENNYLREEWKYQQIEKEKKLEKEKLKKKNAKPKFLARDLKLFDPSGLTFDSNGNILKLNIQNINSFQKDFINSKITLKNKTEEIVQPTPPPQINEESNNNLNKKSHSVKKRKSSIIATEDDKKEIIEYNEDTHMHFDYNYHYNLNKRINQKKNLDKIVLSGSNFEKISPEIGVIISNNDNNKKEKKIGGFDYIKKYNRPSMNELSQYLLNSNSNNNSPYNSNSRLTSFLYSYSNANNNFNNYKIDNNYIGYKEDFSEDKNPLFKNAFHLNEGKRRKSRNLIFKKEISEQKSLSNENIFIRNNWNKSSKNKNNIVLFGEQNINNNNDNINNNYLSSVNNILLSQKFNLPNLKSVFYESEEKNINPDINKNKNKKLANIKIMKENKSNLIYSLNDIMKDNKNLLPNIKVDNNKNKNNFGRDYINKFLVNTIQKRNMSYDNLDNMNDINKDNSYKNIFLRVKKTAKIV